MVALVALLLVVSPASAQEPPEAESGTRLHPGVNLIGWVGEPTPVSQLFREIPQLEAVWAWDAELDDWIVAARNAPEWLGGLGRVSAGMGLRMQLGGDAPVIWERSTEPTRGLVKLRTGWNLVAWSGADGASIENVAKGIGWSLRSVRRWDAATQQWATWSSPERSAQVIADTGDEEEAESPGVRRGEALWVKVSRSVNWLQPTGMMPQLVFPGGASEDVRQAAENFIVPFLAFFRETFGFEADASSYDIWMPTSGDALRQAASDVGVSAERAAGLPEFWDSAIGWVDSFRSDKRTVVLRQPSREWESWGLLAHEYFHVLQHQLSDGGRWPPGWLIEGSAEWAEDEYLVLVDGGSTWAGLHEWNRRDARGAPPIREIEQGKNGWWPYLLGWLAVSRLNERAGADAWIEFWRRVAPTTSGPHGRWTSSLDWEHVFEDIFGISTADFYVDFDTAIGESDDSGGQTEYIRGLIVQSSSAPTDQLTVRAIKVEDDVNIEWPAPAATESDGSFAIAMASSGTYRLSVDISTGCRRYYTDGGVTAQYSDAELVEVSTQGVSGITIQLPPNICGWQIRGRVVDSDGEPLAGTAIAACRTDGDCVWGERTESDGAFAVPAAKPGDYRLHLDLVDGCSVYYSRSGPMFERNDASLITVADADVDGIVMRVSTDICHLRVGGSVGGIERFLDGYVWVHLCQVVENWCRSTTSRRTENDGPFAVAVPDAGAYRLTYNFDGCAIHHGTTGLTSNAADATLINIGERDMRVGHRQVPADVCAYEISGTIIDADGNPLAETHVSACQITGEQCVSRTGRRSDEDGTFAITVPVDGAYRISFSLDGCSVYFGRGRLTSNSRDAWAIRVAGRDVQVSPRAVPEGMCAQQISGRLVDSDDAPLSGVYISICQLVGGDCAVWLGRNTDEDGMFAVTVPTEGAYRVSFSLEGCSVYYRVGGLTTTHAEASQVSVTEANSPNLRMRVPEGVCAWQIKGSITTSGGQPLADTYVSVCREVGNDCVDWLGLNTDNGGTFAITVPVEGEYRVSINFEGCAIYFRSGGLTTTFSERSTVRVEGRDVRLNPHQIPAGMCAWQIKGSITSSDGQPLTDTRISACREVDNECVNRVGRNTDADGSFAITVPTEGRYRLSFNLEGCTIYFRRGGFTTTRSERSTVRVEGRSVRLNPRQVPEGMCAQQISGRLVDSNNMPLSGGTIYICQLVDGSCKEGWYGRSTDDDGSFARTLSSEGAYLLYVDLDGCKAYYRVGGLTIIRDEASPISVTEANSPNLRMRVPAEMCAQRISGRFVDAAGAPLAEKWINAFGPGGSGGVWTDANGRFEIRVPADGAYHFGIRLRSQPYCWYDLSGQVFGSRDRPVRVSGADVSSVELRLPDTIENLCE